MNKLFSIQEVANLLGVSAKTLRRWEEKGILAPHRTPGNQRRYTQEQIDNFKRQRNGLAESPIYQIPVTPPSQLFSQPSYQRESEKIPVGHPSTNAQYWAEEMVKSILVFKKLAVSAVFVMFFVAVAGVEGCE